MTDGPRRAEPARPRRRRVIVSVAAGAVGCLAAGLAATLAPASPGTERAPAPRPVSAAGFDRRAAGTVLANRARAVRERDRTAFLATVATAPAAFQREQETLFDNLLRLPLQDWRERLADAPAESGPGAVTVRIDLRYRLRGHDPGPVARTRYLAFAPRDGGWVIRGPGRPGPGAAPAQAEIWDDRPVRVVRGRSSLVIGDAAGLEEIARRLDAALPAVSRVVGDGWPRRAVALAPADPERAAALVGGGRDLASIAALAVAAGDAGDRIVISPAAFPRLNGLGRSVVLTHELTHVATGGARDGRTPLWLIEGLADYVGYRDAKVAVRDAAGELRREVAAGRLPDALPGPAAFDGGSGRLSQAYQEAWLACRMIAQRYGEATLVRLYRAAGRASEDAALRAVLGVDRARLTALWRDYLRRELR
ncbi:hypothetical protein [Actinomadura kijaniata]|uniref:hypothetical protein n=1 Tax=Actinomadura kijaniata TaxID=46161 RepID=UPI000A077356|nr:hypothetical protein [Actinomadura kijaniata]